MTKESIKQLIEENLEARHINVNGDDGEHFDATVVSDNFIGLNTVKQHQLVYAALGNRIQSGEIHALALKTFTPEEWAKLNG